VSKKYKKGRRQQKGSLNPLILLVGGGVLMIVAALFSPSEIGDGSGTPALAVDQEVIDYGDVKLETET
jgi:hypothetical protein